MLLDFLPKNKKWYSINIVGIAIAFAAVLLVSSYTIHELSYDKFHNKAEDICRIQLDKPMGGNSILSPEILGNMVFPLYDKFPAINDVLRIYEAQNSIVQVEKEKFYPTNIYKTSNKFFQFFDFKLTQGNRQELFNHSKEAAISEKTAMAYFGSLDVVGKEFSLIDDIFNRKETYTVRAVLEDTPGNSHIQADILLSIPAEEDKTNDVLSYTYLLLNKNTNTGELRERINTYWAKNTPDGEMVPSVELLPLTDIHLKSHTLRELSKNRKLSSIVILISGALIVLLIALINYANLNYVQFLSELKDLKVRIVNGASTFDLVGVSIAKSALQCVIAIALGLLAAYTFNRSSHFSYEFTIFSWSTVLIAILFVALFALMSIIPLYTKKLSGNLCQQIDQGSKKFVVSLVFQFTLSIAAIILTIVFQGQTNLIGDLHPGKEKENIVVLSNVPYSAIAKYETFKQQCMQHPEIKQISGSTVQPGVVAPLIYPFEMEGYEKKEDEKITILSIDEDFFKLFDIQSIAGNLEMGRTSTVTWEQIAISIHQYSRRNEENLKRLKEYNESHPGFKEKYIINKAALNLLGLTDPKEAIGKSFKVNFDAPHMFPKGEIIAVIDHLHYGDLFTKEVPMVLASKRLFNSTFFAKVDASNKQKAIEILQEEWLKVNPNYPLRYEILTNIYDEIYSNQYNEMKALTLFAILSILLSTLGMFALSSYSIQHKTKEIGIKKANGASSLEILLELIFEYTQWVILAFILACPVAFYIARDWLSNFAYKVEVSWWMFALSGLIALVIAMITVSWQTWKAARQNPVYALKYE